MRYQEKMGKGGNTKRKEKIMRKERGKYQDEEKREEGYQEERERGKVVREEGEREENTKRKDR